MALLMLLTPAPKTVKGAEEAYAGKEYYFEGVTPENVCLFAVVKKDLGKDSLASDNLLYIDQGYADDEGAVRFYACVDSDEENSTVLLINGQCWHKWGEWTIEKPATYTEKGQKSRKCQLCEVTEYEAIPVLEKMEQVITGTDRYAKTYNDRQFALDCALAEGNGILSYSSADDSIASVDGSGNVTVNGVGDTSISVRAEETVEYMSAEKIVQISVAKGKQTLDVSYPTNVIKVGQTIKFSVSNELDNIEYVSSNPEIGSVDDQGALTANAEGIVTITIRSNGNEYYEAAETNISITVINAEKELKPLSECSIELLEKKYVFDGTEKKPKIIVRNGEYTLVEEKDYQVCYLNNRNPGIATVNIVALPGSSYTGNCAVEFEIKEQIKEDASSIAPYAFSNCENLISVNIKDTVAEIGEGAFADCKYLSAIYFYGSCPQLGTDVFRNVNANVYYPYNDSSWTLEALENYGGNLTWIPWNPAANSVEKRALSVCRISMDQTSYIYDGKEKIPFLDVSDGMKKLQQGIDYNIFCANNMDAGFATVTIHGIGNYGGSYETGFTIEPAESILSFGEEAVVKTYGDSVFIHSLKEKLTDGMVVYTSDNAEVASVDGNTGEVTIHGAGTATITATAMAGKNYKSGTTSYCLTVMKASNTISASDIVKTYSKKLQKTYIKGTSLENAALTYSSDNKSIKVDKNGVVTIPKKYVGSAKITIKAAETKNYAEAVKTITVSVKPEKTRVIKVKNVSKSSIEIQWKKISYATGYEIQYSTDKNFKKSVKKKTIKKPNTTSYTVGKLKKGNTYYVRIRTYKKTGAQMNYSLWSSTKKVVKKG